MRADYPGGTDLPAWVAEPGPYLRVLDQDLVDLTPWHLMTRDQVLRRVEGLQQRYVGKARFPFARRQDNDDIACWDAERPGMVVVIHDFASAGSEERKTYASFWDWFRAAIDDLIEFDD
jgi:hypothetical protein